MEYQTHIRVQNLNVFYQNEQVLKNITVNIPDRKITAIIGPSGCGKTTLLKSFNRLIDSIEGVHITGEIFVDEENILDPKIELTHIRKKMGLLLQKPYPLPMSIYENVAYGPRIHGQRDRRKLDRIVETYLKKASLWDEVKEKLHEPASRLSLGQQQRICIARVLAVKPEVILFDESTSALDPIATGGIEDLISELKKDYTIVIVTHNMQQAGRVSDYTGLFWLGELVEFGPTEKIFTRPEKELTDAYLTGKMG